MASIRQNDGDFTLLIDGTAILHAGTVQEVESWMAVLGLTHSIVFA